MLKKRWSTAMEFSLRTWRMDDAESLAKAISNKKIQANLRDGLPYPYTTADGEMYIQSVLDSAPDSQYVYAIVVDGVPSGCVGIHRKDNIHRRTAELGYYLAEEHWGKGIVSAAVRECCRRAFAETDLLRIFAEPFSTNKASCRVLEKSGFRLEGTLRQNAVKDGRVIDMQMYALIKE